MRNNKYSDFKLVAFPDKLESFRNEIVTAPVYVRIKPINKCNHACFFCVYSDGFRPGDRENHIVSGMHTDMREHDVLPWTKLQEVLNDLHDMGVKAVTFSGGGEPLIYPKIVEAAQTVLDYGLDLSIITNGQALSKARAEVFSQGHWVRISMDYINAAQMIHSRNVTVEHYDSVFKNIESFAKLKKSTCDLGVNYIVHQTNYLGLGLFARKLKDIGVNNLRVSPMWVPDIAKYHAQIQGHVQRELDLCQDLIDDKFTVNSTYNIAGKSNTRSYDKCFYMQTVPVIGADQVVYACHNKAYDNTGAIGSITGQSFKDLWFSPETKKVFDELNPRHVCQHECANDKKNIFIHQLVDTSMDNFV